jgi:hypothetical protein
MAHDPRCDMSIDRELNADFPFNRIGALYRVAVARKWTEEKFADKLQGMLARNAAARQAKLAGSVTAKISHVSPVVVIPAVVDQVCEETPYPDPLEVEAAFRATYGEPEYIDDLGWGDNIPDLDYSDDSGRSLEDLS